MMAGINALLESNSDLTRGNHKVALKNNKRYFSYFATDICVADDNKRIAVIDNGGYYTSSTTRAINDYIRYFEGANYTIVDNRC